MQKHLEIEFSPLHRLNPGFGYRLLVRDSFTGEILLYTGKAPDTGRDLMTAADCMRVAAMYVAPNEVEQATPQVMAPSWENAPNWAKWLAQDADGEWRWYERKPEPADPEEVWGAYWEPDDRGRSMMARRGEGVPDTWLHSLEHRPGVPSESL